MVRGRQIGFLCAALCFVLYAWILFANASFAVGGSDSSGYFNTARLLIRGQVVERVAALQTYGLDESFLPVFVPFGFVPGRHPSTMVPLYPPGFPIHVAVAATLFGWTVAPYLVSPLAALAGVVLMAILLRELRLSIGAAIGGAAVFAALPFFLFMAIQPMGDVVATLWTLVGVLSALRSRRSAGWALVAGAGFGISLLVRPTNLLLAPALFLALNWRPKALGLFAIGVAPFLSFLFLYNRAVYGGALHTGYGVAGLLSAVTLRSFPTRLGENLGWLARTMSPIVPILWAALAFDRKVALRDRLLILSWGLAFLVFYSCYAYEPVSWWTLRFLLPAIPGVIAGALMVWRDLIGPRIRGSSRLRPALEAALLGIVLLFEVAAVRRHHVLGTDEDQARHPKSSLWAARMLPPRAVVLSREMSGAVRFYTTATPARWETLDPKRFAVFRERTAARGSALYALLLPGEFEQMRKNCPGDWLQLGKVMDVGLWKLQ